jgi:hypothetical protein
MRDFFFVKPREIVHYDCKYLHDNFIHLQSEKRQFQTGIKDDGSKHTN